MAAFSIKIDLNFLKGEHNLYTRSLHTDEEDLASWLIKKILDDQLVQTNHFVEIKGESTLRGKQNIQVFFLCISMAD